MNATGSLVYRGVVIAACVFTVWQSVRIAIADRMASANTIQALAKAVHYSPGDARLTARLAVARSDANEQDPGIDDQLRRAARLDPFNSEVLMTLGLREEFEGNRAAAERELKRATEMDRQFKPAWTLANFYMRAGESNKVLPVIARALKLEPLNFDTGPVFDLCWQAAGDTPARILELIPKEGPKRVQYLAFLMSTQRTEAILQAWPEAMAAADPKNPPDVETLTRLVDFLAKANRIAEAVAAWNQLVDRRFVHYGRLEPAKGQSIADPGFQFPAAERGFAWRLSDVPGVSARIFGGSLTMEVSGDEPESFAVLSAPAPLMPNRDYRLVWKGDASELRDPRDPGFFFRIAQGNATKDCPVLTAGACEFPSATGASLVPATLSLNYTRAQGTTRASGALGVSAVRLEFAP